MDYYEELGLSRSASPEEIRQAYRRVARLLHPDRCADDEVRLVADLQMKRLNGIFAILTNSASRAAYDRRLLPLSELARPSAPQGRWRQSVVLTASAVLIAILIWVMLRPHPSPVHIQPTIISADSNRTVPAPVSSAHRSLRSRESAPAQPSANPPALPASDPLFTDDPLPITPLLPVGPPELPPLPAVLPAPPAPDSLEGEWLYVAAAQAKETGMYSPEYIELRVTGNAGVLTGRYRARYRVPDRAISPDVAFRFQGRSSRDSASMPWIGAGGARGELTLLLLRNGRLEVTWVADQLGEDLGLVSGTATLVRKQE